MTATLNLILETQDDQKVLARSPKFPGCIAIADTQSPFLSRAINTRSRLLMEGR